MASLSMNVLGFPAVNSQLTVQVQEPLTGRLIATVKPFLDGTVSIPKIDAGAYQVSVLHPNLALPVLTRPIHVVPVGVTKVSVLIDPSRFRNTPIEDIPDANLGPVRDRVESVSETILPLTHKAPGESIRADDWNAMAGAVRDMAESVSELTRLVAPTGHDHRELTNKIEEMQGNFTTLLETLSGAMAELQRQIQALRLRRQAEDVITKAGLPSTHAKAIEMIDVVTKLEAQVTASPPAYARAARTAGVRINTALEQILDERGDDDDLLDSAQVRNLSSASNILKSQTATTYGAELETHRKADRVFGGGALSKILPKE